MQRESILWEVQTIAKSKNAELHANTLAVRYINFVGFISEQYMWSRLIYLITYPEKNADDQLTSRLNTLQIFYSKLQLPLLPPTASLPHFLSLSLSLTLSTFSLPSP